MEQVYDIFKSFVDPVFIIFILLLVTFFIYWVSSKKKIDMLPLLFVIVLFYGFSIYPVSNYLSYQLEKEYITGAPVKAKMTPDVIVVLSGGASDINALAKTFPGETTTVRLVHAVQMFKKYDARYLVCSGKSNSKVADARVMAHMAEELGVPKDKIRIEPASRNTYEHAVQFNKIFAGKDVTIGLVTSASHMKRSEKEFRKYFRNVLPLPTGYLYASPAGTAAVRYIPQSRWLYNNALVFHEFVGNVWYRIKDGGSWIVNRL